jgi:hypothetical protein
MTEEPSLKKRRITTTPEPSKDHDILIDDVLYEIIKTMPFREQCQARRICKQWQRCVCRAVHRVLITDHPWTLGSLLEQFPKVTELAISSRMIWTPVSDGFHIQSLPSYVPLMTRLDIEMDSSASPQWGFLSQLKNLKEFKFIKASAGRDGDDDIWNEIPVTVETLSIEIRKVENLAEILSHLRSLKTLVLECSVYISGVPSPLKELRLPTGLEELSIKVNKVMISMDMSWLLERLHGSNLDMTLRCLKIWGHIHTFPIEGSSHHIFPLVETLGLFGHGHGVSIPVFGAFPNVSHLMTDSGIKSCHHQNFPKLRHLSIDMYNDIPNAHLIWMDMSLTHLSVHMQLKNKKPETEIRMLQSIEVLIAIQRLTLKELTFYGPMPWTIFKWNMFYNIPLLEKFTLTEWCMFDTLSKFARRLPVMHSNQGHEFDFIKEEK